MQALKVVWTVIDNHFSFTRDDSEWKNTDIVFEIARLAGKTEVSFTHVGLVPAYECYNICVDGWTTYLDSLRDLITFGLGQPNPGEARTKSEHALVRASRPREGARRLLKQADFCGTVTSVPFDLTVFTHRLPAGRLRSLRDGQVVSRGTRTAPHP